jgi:flagellar basal-body rod protein FlgG
MDHGLYTAYLGLRARQHALDVTANNIANAATPGFKADRMNYKSIEAAEMEESGQALRREAVAEFQVPDTSTDIDHGRKVGLVSRTTIDFTPGEFRGTDRPLDVALDGDGFLVVQTPQGERYTRAGSLKLNPTGQLVTQTGDFVLGERGPITVPAGEVFISERGDISVQGETVGRLKLVRFDNPQSALLKEGNSLFIARTQGGPQPLQANSTRVLQGSLEASNAISFTEMAAMIQNSREFDSLQKTLTTLMNDLGRKVASEIGRL